MMTKHACSASCPCQRGRDLAVAERVVQRTTDQAIAERVAARFKQAIGVGETIEKGMLRIHRYRDHYVFWDLTNAGKRGKKVPRMSIVPSYGASMKADEMLNNWAKTLQHVDSYDEVRRLFSDILVDYPQDFRMEVHEERGIDVMPAGVKPIQIKTPFVEIEASMRDFTISDLVDTANAPRCIPSIKGGLSSIPVFYRWVQENMSALQHMKYQDILKTMGELGIKYHDYCSMD